jgi:hypothetical protein
MEQLATEVGLSSRYFLTREKGEQAYPLIKSQLEALPEGQALLLAFPADQVMDVSFVDETLVRLMRELIENAYGQRTILLGGLTEDSIQNIEAALHLQKLKINFWAVQPDGDWRCIGPLESKLQETLELVARRGHVTAPQLAKWRKIAINTASNRLKRLYDKRLLRREYEISQKGLQYIYSFWTWAS